MTNPTPNKYCTCGIGPWVDFPELEIRSDYIRKGIKCQNCDGVGYGNAYFTTLPAHFQHMVIRMLLQVRHERSVIYMRSQIDLDLTAEQLKLEETILQMLNKEMPK